ncbi:AAEL017114-PA [Aedes aegypti]|uniref:AAEL017114-PA n=1 Tax=Aedes aegypti TaxID=7159 RepID=J9HJN5_AEDAE|nr:AAEL017114-PA [Aedes aegypti]
MYNYNMLVFGSSSIVFSFWCSCDFWGHVKMRSLELLCCYFCVLFVLFSNSFFLNWFMCVTLGSISCRVYLTEQFTLFHVREKLEEKTLGVTINNEESVTLSLDKAQTSSVTTYINLFS